jgi:hypothetical protein
MTLSIGQLKYPHDMADVSPQYEQSLSNSQTSRGRSHGLAIRRIHTTAEAVYS